MAEFIVCASFTVLVLIPGVINQDLDTTKDGIPVTCDPLSAKGTNVLCTQPRSISSTDCSQPSIPGTVASYACRNPMNDVLRGLLNCNEDGIWISSLREGNTSLCGLEAGIINIQYPDIAVATNDPGFTTPSTLDMSLLQQDLSNLEDYQKVALQLHNTFRRNHGVEKLGMAPLMNEAAQNLADFIAFGNSSDFVDPDKRLTLLNVTLNIESNWYLQAPQISNKIDAVSKAIQSWYATGFLNYDWQNVAKNLERGESLGFSRIIWKTTKFIGIGVTNFNGVTFVACIYTPGRFIGSTDPVAEFKSNVLPVKVGRQ